MTTKALATIITVEHLELRHKPLPRSWTNAAGMLKGKSPKPLAYQRAIRREWDERSKRQKKLAQ